MTVSKGTSFSSLIAYADESGSPTLTGIDPDYPIFVLAFVVVDKAHYAKYLVPALQRLKFDFFGHDQVALHEREVRREEGPFAFLQIDRDLRVRFMKRLNAVVDDAEMKVVATVVDKRSERYGESDDWDGYDAAMRSCVSRMATLLNNDIAPDAVQHVVFESRGRREDRTLELGFRRFTDDVMGRRDAGRPSTRWRPVFASKMANSAGLQLADLLARPIGLSYLRPEQPNRAFEVIRPKLLEGRYEVLR